MTVRRRRGDASSSLCQAVCESISAAADDEAATVAPMVVSAHLADCPHCRSFAESLGRLSRHFTMHPVGGPTTIGSELAVLLGATPPLGARLVEALRVLAIVHRPSWRRSAQWALGIIPLGVALPLLAIGVSGARGLPSHVLTPCTAALHQRLALR